MHWPACVALLVGVLFLLLMCLRSSTRGRCPWPPPPAASPPDVREIPQVLSPGECWELIAAARSRGLEPSAVVDPKTGGSALDPAARSSRQTWFASGDHPVTRGGPTEPPPVRAAVRLELLTEMFTGLPSSHQEALQVARYSMGEQFRNHYDACDQSEAVCNAMTRSQGQGTLGTAYNRGAGQRLWTLLVYLNDDFDGGAPWGPVFFSWKHPGHNCVPVHGALYSTPARERDPVSLPGLWSWQILRQQHRR